MHTEFLSWQKNYTKMIRQSGVSVIIGVLFYSIDFEKKKKSINKTRPSVFFWQHSNSYLEFWTKYTQTEVPKKHKALPNFYGNTSFLTTQKPKFLRSIDFIPFPLFSLYLRLVFFLIFNCCLVSCQFPAQNPQFPKRQIVFFICVCVCEWQKTKKKKIWETPSKKF